MKIEGMPVFKSSPEERMLRSIFGEAELEPYIEEAPSCECGKYAAERYKGIICDRCGTVCETRKVIVAPFKMKKDEIVRILRERGEL